MATKQSDKKLSHKEVAFEHPAKGPNHCSMCRHFLGGRGHAPFSAHCQIVADPIKAGDWCKEFEER